MLAERSAFMRKPRAVVELGSGPRFPSLLLHRLDDVRAGLCFGRGDLGKATRDRAAPDFGCFCHLQFTSFR
jgi:hypothetical protein